MKKTGKIILSITITTVVLEVLLRFFGISPGVYLVHRLEPYKFDHELGWVTRPGSAYLRISPEYMHYNFYNPQGYPVEFEKRNQPLNRQTNKVVLIGNSFVESYYLPYKKSFPYLLDASIQDKEILNLGVSGYTPAQYLLQARRNLPNFKISSIVVIFVPYQDITYLSAPYFPGGYAKPIFKKGNYTKPSNTPLSNTSPKRTSQIEDFSSIATFLQPVMNSLFGYINPHYNYVLSREQLMFSHEGFQEALNVLKQIKIEFATDKKFMIVYAPSEFELADRSIFEANLNKFTKNCQEIKLECYIPDHFLDTNEDFRKFYYRQDHHPSAYGAEKMASYILKIL